MIPQHRVGEFIPSNFPVFGIAIPKSSKMPISLAKLTIAVLAAASVALGREGKGREIGGKMGTEWDMDVMGNMGSNLQLVDVTASCNTGWEGAEVCCQRSLWNTKRACSDSFSAGIARSKLRPLGDSFSTGTARSKLCRLPANSANPRFEERNASSTK